MDRRAALLAIGAAALPGCTALGPPDRFEAFRDRLEEADVRIKRASADARRWILEYFPASTARGAVLGEVEPIARAYAETVPPAESRAHEQLKCILFDGSRARVGTYRIEAGWARAFAAGGIDAGEYLGRVRGTFER